MTAVLERPAPEEAADPSTPPPPSDGHGRRRRVRPRRPRPPRAPLSDRALVGATALVVVGALTLAVLLQVFAFGTLAQARAQHLLYGQLRQELAAQTAPLGGDVALGEPVALLSIPTLGLQQVVVEGTGGAEMQTGPGHRRDTVLPGQTGVSVLYGRAATYGAPFRSVALLQEGDGIQVTTAQGQFTYRVDGVRRVGDPLPVGTASRLTLVTSAVVGLMPVEAVYVDATLQADAATGAGRTASVPDAEKAFGTDTSGLPLLAFSLGLVLVAVLGLVPLQRRLRPAVLWVLGAPVVLAAVWWSGALAAQLLPNLF